MADRIPVYRSQESVTGTAGKEIVLPSVADAGGAFHDMGRSLLRAAEPVLQERAEEQALRDAGVATIVKDPDTGEFVRGNLTRGGGLAYARVYNRALDARELNLRQIDYEQRMTPLLVEFRRDPEGFAAAATGLAEGAIEGAPPQLRAQLETALTRDLSERVRGLSLRVAEENHDGMVRGLGEQAALLREQARQVYAAADPVNAGDADARAAPILLQLQETIGALRDLGVSEEELEAEGMRVDLALADPRRRAEALDNLRQSGILFGSLDTIEKLETVLVWGNGVRTDDDFNGFKFEDLYERFPDEGPRNDFLQTANAKLQRLKEQQRAALASEPKPETPAEAISRMQFEASGTGTGISVSRGTSASVNQQFLERNGPIGPLLSKPGGGDQVVGFFRQNGYAPIKLNEAILDQVNGGNVVAAVELVNNLRASPAFQGQRTGEQFFNQLPGEVLAAVRWVESVQAYRDPSTVNQLWVEKRKGNVPSLGDVEARFSGMKDPQGQPIGYHGLKRREMQAVLGVNEDGLNATKSVWDRGFDQLVAENMVLYDNPQQALKEAAQLVRSRLVKSPYFFGGLGDARIFNHGMSPRVLDHIVSKHPVYSKIGQFAKFSDTVEAGPEKGRPRLILRRIDREPWSDSLGHYMVIGRDRFGRVQKQWTVNMDDVKGIHDRLRGVALEQQRKAALKAGPEPKWRYETGRDGKKRYVLNPNWKP